VVELVTGPVRVRVPASSANLGPGYDAFGLALRFHDEVTGEITGPGGGPAEITVSGEGADSVSLDESHLVHRALVRGFAELGVPRPGVRLHCANVIPHGRGLGSSSAAIVAGLALARALVTDGRDRLDDDALFAVAAELEGHPDNVAAAVYGGFTIAYGDAGAFRVARLDVTSAVVPVVLVPSLPLETKVARGLLPDVVPHADAARSAGRAALLVAALGGRPEVLMAATADWLHQPYRAPAMPESAAVVARLRDHGHPAVVSGAGPTVLALVAAEHAEEVAACAPEGWRSLVLEVDRLGVRAG
jgi:homoserine kinase